MKTPKALIVWSFLAMSTLLIFLESLKAADVGVFVPASQLFTDGNSGDTYPFLIEQQNFTSMRYQQVYGASEFSAVNPNGGFINQILFRADSHNTHTIMSTIGNIEIDLTTTAKPPDGLSTTFANNVGVDDTIVFSGSLALLAANGSYTTVHLTRPFFYNPSAGNLLMDVRNFTGASGMLDINMPYFDAVNTAGDSVSRVYANGVGASVGTADTTGLITGFFITPVPEPSTFVLFAAGFLGLGVFAKLRRHRGKAAKCEA